MSLLLIFNFFCFFTTWTHRTIVPSQEMYKTKYSKLNQQTKYSKINQQIISKYPTLSTLYTSSSLLVFSQAVCIKITPLQNIQDWIRSKRGLISKEAHILESVTHPNIIQFLNVVVDESYVYLFMGFHGPTLKKDFCHLPSPDYLHDYLFDYNELDPRFDNPDLRDLTRGNTRTDLFEFICENQQICEYKIRKIFKQIVTAIAHMHNLGVAHNDIKDENVFSFLTIDCD
jgi:serine/threonine protein kinase